MIISRQIVERIISNWTDTSVTLMQPTNGHDDRSMWLLMVIDCIGYLRDDFRSIFLDFSTKKL